jgi:hypothetical protein
MQEMKIKIVDGRHSRAVQEALFELGYEWGRCGQTVSHTNKAYLYSWVDGSICYSSDDDPEWAEYVLYKGALVKGEAPKRILVLEEMDENVQRRHVVRSWTMFFRDIITGLRTSDIRLADREYRVGDEMLLQEYDPVEEMYTGREQLVRITYIQGSKSNPCAISHLALDDKYVVLSIKLVA